VLISNNHYMKTSTVLIFTLISMWVATLFFMGFGTDNTTTTQGYTQEQVDTMLYNEALWWSSTHMSILDAVAARDIDSVVASEDLMLSRIDKYGKRVVK
jgi:hypothetical protein